MEGKTLALAVVMVGTVAIGLGVLLLHAGGVPPAPEPPKPPPAPEALMNSTLKYSPQIFRALVEQDAKAFRIPAPTPAELAAPNAYFEEFQGRRKLKVKSPFETQHLRLTLQIEKRQANLGGQSFSSEHLVLHIENRTPRFLAYRVRTAVGDRTKCASKGDIPHNALVLEPSQTLVRSECLYRSDAAVEVLGVEVMEVTPLGAFYVSRLQPHVTLFDQRTAAGHVPLEGAPCPQTFSWREIQEGLDRKQLGWRDVIDFYARHNCDEYSFWSGYRYRTDPAAPLPARSE